MEHIRKIVKTLSNNLSKKTSAPDFWALVRMLENADSSKPRIGYAKNPAHENVRFGQKPHLYLPASEVAEIIEGKRAGVDATIFTYFLGLLGINGPMPLEFTNYVYQRSFSHFDHTWRRFLDIIHHRMHTLYYRAFAQNEQSLCYDHPEEDAIKNIIKSLAGLPPNMNFDADCEKIALSYANRFSFIARNREGLEEILRNTLKTNVTVNDFVIALYDINPNDYAMLGNKKTAMLGVNLQIGRRYLSAAHRFEIDIGPIDSNAYHTLLSKPGFFLNKIMKIVRLYLVRPLDYVLRLHFAQGFITPARLGFKIGDLRPVQLGFFGWIGNTDTELELRIDVSRFNRIKEGVRYG
jgi:type VI secretion system protein ImpH